MDEKVNLDPDASIDDRFCSILESWETKVYRAAAMMCGETCEDAGIAEEILAEVFSRLYRNIHELPSDISIPRVVCEYLLESIGSASMRGRVLSKSRNRRMAQLAVDFPSDLDELEEPALMVTSRLRSILSSALGQLPKEYRDLLILRDYFGHTYTECSSILGLTENNARVLAHKARLLLRKVIHESGQAIAVIQSATIAQERSLQMNHITRNISEE